MKRYGLSYLFLSALFSLIVVHSSYAQQFISFGTGTEGGLYYIWGGGWAKVMNKALPGIEVTAESTGGSTANCQLIERGKLQVGFSLAQVTYDMYTDKKMKNLRALFPAYPGYYYFYALKKSGLKTLYDVNGKDIGYVKGLHDTTVKIFETLGIKPAKSHILTHAATVEGLQDGTLHCSAVIGPEKWPGLTSIEATHDIVFLTMAEKDIQAIINVFQAYRRGVVPKGSYKTLSDKPYETVVDWNLILASKSLSEDLAYKLVKATYERNPDLVAVHPVSSATKVENAINTPIPLHPGTIKYLREMKVSIPPSLIPTE
ncbi:MAG: TAXI family TRAP transporter solute-binding subunit [Deltaproteobacteria bacterium]|nr:TAXI family TRAP transporter solute-binding subunit [Deltaproteobacteria bacterium]